MTFKPTGTSQILIESIRPHINKGTLLDLGCGSGIVGQSLLKDGLEVFASDIDKDVFVDPPIISRQGNLFDCWENWKFDYICDDVSGICKDIAQESDWFKGVSCESGEDGTDLICEVLRQSPKYLNDNGILFFPIVSLSNEDKILDLANKIFHVEQIGHKDFPLPKELYTIVRQKGGIKIQERYGIITFHTNIYKATL